MVRESLTSWHKISLKGLMCCQSFFYLISYVVQHVKTNGKTIKGIFKLHLFISWKIADIKRIQHFSQELLRNIKNALFVEVSKVGDRSRGLSESSLFNSHYTEVWGRALLLFLDCFTLSLKRTL